MPLKPSESLCDGHEGLTLARVLPTPCVDPLARFRSLKDRVGESLPSLVVTEKDAKEYRLGVMPKHFWSSVRLSPATKALIEKGQRVRTYNFRALPLKRTKSVKANWKRASVRKQVEDQSRIRSRRRDNVRVKTDPAYSWRKYRLRARRKCPDLPFDISKEDWDRVFLKTLQATPNGRFPAIRRIDGSLGYTYGNLLFCEPVTPGIGGKLGSTEGRILKALKEDLRENRKRFTTYDSLLEYIRTNSHYNKLKQYMDIYYIL